jgi:hypothetical protein
MVLLANARNGRLHSCLKHALHNLQQQIILTKLFLTELFHGRLTSLPSENVETQC